LVGVVSSVFAAGSAGGSAGSEGSAAGSVGASAPFVAAGGSVTGASSESPSHPIKKADNAINAHTDNILIALFSIKKLLILFYWLLTFYKKYSDCKIKKPVLFYFA
jgi:hypothetical protein